MTLSASPNEGSFFAGWGGDCASCNSNASCPLVINRDISCAATFNSILPPNLKLTVTKSSTGEGTVISDPQGVSCGNDCEEDFAANTTVTLISGWGGACSLCGSNSSCSIIMDTEKTYEANFDAIPPTTVTLVATESNSVFNSWSGDCSDRGLLKNMSGSHEF